MTIKKEYRALQLWSLLVLAARNQQILSYATVERLTRIPKHAVGDYLEPIQAYCKRHKLPPLTVLVVKEETGLPGDGFTEASEGAQACVFVFDWFKRKAPLPEDFSD
jgi:hypothetical protein